MLNPVEKEMLKRTVLDDFESQTIPPDVDVATLMKIVKKHTAIKNEQALYESLSSALYGIDSEQPQGGRTLTELLEKRFIQFSDASLDWQSAVALATEPLLKANFVTEAYVAAMIENLKEMEAADPAKYPIIFIALMQNCSGHGYQETVECACVFEIWRS